jgi:hypothetical protein
VFRGGFGIADVDSGLYVVVCSLSMWSFKICVDAIHTKRHMIQIVCHCNCIVMFCIEVLSDEWHNVNVRASASRCIMHTLWSIIQLRLYAMRSINDDVVYTPKSHFSDFTRIFV